MKETRLGAGLAEQVQEQRAREVEERKKLAGAPEGSESSVAKGVFCACCEESWEPSSFSSAVDQAVGVAVCTCTCTGTSVMTRLMPERFQQLSNVYPTA